jgi:hypothetical protein
MSIKYRSFVIEIDKKIDTQEGWEFLFTTELVLMEFLKIELIEHLFNVLLTVIFKPFLWPDCTTFSLAFCLDLLPKHGPYQSMETSKSKHQADS